MYEIGVNEFMNESIFKELAMSELKEKQSWDLDRKIEYAKANKEKCNTIIYIINKGVSKFVG